MAAGVLPAPGTRYGACINPCEHHDCQATRNQAKAACAECSKPIGYNRRFYSQDNGLAHADCAEAAAERAKS
jgi:hypothetical protein